MGIFKFLFSTPKRSTPIHSVRRRVLLAGTQYSVRLEPSTRNCVRIEGTVLVFGLKEMTRENFELYFAQWYRRQARKLFQNSIDSWRVAMERMGYFTPDARIKIFDMRRAWGRCYYTKDLITLNLHLAKTPVECIDYITLHELCHFLINNHSNDFYAIMSRIDPDWRIKEATLKRFAAQFLR